MNTEEAFQYLVQKLQAIYEPGESANIADWVLEALTGKRGRERSLEKERLLTSAELLQLERYTAELLRHRPVQYVLGESYFYDMKLYVDERVLIPRPETEELAHWLLQHLRNASASPAVLDIGTGSGCLALAIKKQCPSATVYALDISEGALAVAARNAATLELDIILRQGDILRGAPDDLPGPDVIISNPPYITLPEKESILPHVLGYEPHTALFVTDNDPLQFYKAIEAYASAGLQPQGAVFLELHRDFALQTQQYYKDKGWETILKKDMQGEDRMLYCRRPQKETPSV